MARASTRTWLSLDRFAEIVGLDPLHFNQLNSTVLKQRVICGEVWYQYAWQDANRVSREDVAMAIQQAEQRLSSYIGYDLLPVWHKDEEVRTDRPARSEFFSTGVNVRGMSKSVRAQKGYLIAAGQRKKDLVQAGVVVVRSDDDADGYSELVTITLATTIDPCQLHVYLPGVNGDDRWEIRPIKFSSAGGVVTITFKSWQLVDPTLFETYVPAPIDADDNSHYLTIVDVYRIYADTSAQVTFLWENPASSCGCGQATCSECTLAAQTGCLSVRDDRLGFLSYRPADWDPNTLTFTPRPYWNGRDPDKMLISYLAGWTYDSADCIYTQIDPFWEYTIAYLAASLLDKEICTCENVKRFIGHWQEDLARIEPDGSYLITARQQNNPFGTARGGVYAYNNCGLPGRSIAV